MNPTKVGVVAAAVLVAFAVNRMVGLDRMLAAA